MKIYYKVSFDFEDDSRNANSQDFRDLLMETFQQAALEGRMTNVRVDLDHARMEPAHKWTGCQSDPFNHPGEWVRYCSVCGIEDTCEDPLPPCCGHQPKGVTA